MFSSMNYPILYFAFIVPYAAALLRGRLSSDADVCVLGEPL